MEIIKRNGQIVEFDLDKIYSAVEKAFIACGYKSMVSDFKRNLEEEDWTKLGEPLTVEKVQDRLEEILYLSGFMDVHKNFLLYRSSRALARESKNKKIFESIIATENNDVTRDNANMNSDTPAGMMMKFASETSKPFVDKYLIANDVKEAVKDNILYIHDKDYFPTRSLTCIQHPLDRILTKGFMAGHGEARPAKRIETAAILAAISMETIQNEMHGGQAIPAFDFYMAPYVRLTYQEEVEKIKELNVFNISDTAWEGIKNAQIHDYTIEELPENEYLKVIQFAINNTVKRVHQAMESFIHNMNSIHSRGGNQVVFSSINYGTDTSAEGRCIMRELLLSTEKGVGNNATAIFPIQIWKMKAGVSVNPEDRNYDLYKLACRVSARRFFPNFLNLDASYNKDDNWNEEDPRRFEHEVATMGALAGHEHLYIKIGDNQPLDISIKELFEMCKSKTNMVGRPSQIWYNKAPLNESLPGKSIQGKYDFPTKSGVYSITYLPEDVTYIGSSSSISRRFAEHRCNIKKTGGLDAGCYFGDNNLLNYEFKVLEVTENYKDVEKKYIEKFPNINFRGISNKYYKNITQKFKKRVYDRPNFRQDLSYKQDLIDLNEFDIKVLDRDNKWVKVKHIFKNDKHNSPFMMHIYYKEYDKELCLSCTEDHPLWNGEKFIRADQYKIGDKIYRADGLEMMVTDISWHWETVDSYDIGTETGSFIGSDVIMHNCRTRVYENRFGDRTSIGRGNLSFSTINLPKLAIKVAIEDGYLDGTQFNEAKNDHESKRRRFEMLKGSLKEYIWITAKQLDDRFKFQKKALVKQFPLLMAGMWNGSDKLGPNDTIEPVINQGTLGIGFIGLAETLIAITGKHHGESELSQAFGLELISMMKEEINKVSEKYQHNYAVLATPAEGLSGKFTELDRKEFGIIPGVTDKNYYTNSNHVPVYYKCTAMHKAQIECPYHKYTTGGHIFYVEVDTDITKNIEVIDTINKIARDNDGGYISINHAQGRCNVCNFESNDPELAVGTECPHCHTKGSWDVLARITGYLVNTSNRWNSYKLSELHDRVQHV